MISNQIPYQSDLNRSDFSISELFARVNSNFRTDWKDIYQNSGVYIVYCTEPLKLKFNDHGGLSRATLCDIKNLNKKWLEINSYKNTDTIYIGRGNVKKRVIALIRFGLGKAKNHRGGEWMWQISDLSKIRIMISSCPLGKEVAYEKYLLDKFKSEHNNWPIANRTGGNGFEIWHP